MSTREDLAECVRECEELRGLLKATTASLNRAIEGRDAAMRDAHDAVERARAMSRERDAALAKLRDEQNTNEVALEALTATLNSTSRQRDAARVEVTRIRKVATDYASRLLREACEPDEVTRIAEQLHDEIVPPGWPHERDSLIGTLTPGEPCPGCGWTVHKIMIERDNATARVRCSRCGHEFEVRP